MLESLDDWFWKFIQIVQKDIISILLVLLFFQFSIIMQLHHFSAKPAPYSEVDYCEYRNHNEKRSSFFRLHPFKSFATLSSLESFLQYNPISQTITYSHLGKLLVASLLEQRCLSEINQQKTHWLNKQLHIFQNDTCGNSQFRYRVFIGLTFKTIFGLLFHFHLMHVYSHIFDINLSGEITTLWTVYEAKFETQFW